MLFKYYSIIFLQQIYNFAVLFQWKFYENYKQ